MGLSANQQSTSKDYLFIIKKKKKQSIFNNIGHRRRASTCMGRPKCFRCLLNNFINFVIKKMLCFTSLFTSNLARKSSLTETSITYA